MKSVVWDGDWTITQEFGVNADYYGPLFGLWAGHNGLDVGCPVGTVLRAPEGGTVTEVSNDPQGYGLTLYVTGLSGRGYRYGHCSRIDMRQGDQVTAGQQLSLSGNTGNSSGPHLHFGVRPVSPDYGNGASGYINPRPILKQLEEEQVSPEQQRILDAAARHGLDDAGIDNMMGINQTLGEQRDSLEELLRTAQVERDAQATEAARLRALVTAAPGAGVKRVEVTLDDDRVEVLNR